MSAVVARFPAYAVFKGFKFCRCQFHSLQSAITFSASWPSVTPYSATRYPGLVAPLGSIDHFSAARPHTS